MKLFRLFAETQEPVKTVFRIRRICHAALGFLAGRWRRDDHIFSGNPVGRCGAMLSIRLLQSDNSPTDFFKITSGRQRIVNDRTNHRFRVNDKDSPNSLCTFLNPEDVWLPPLSKALPAQPSSLQHNNHYVPSYICLRHYSALFLSMLRHFR